MKWIDVKKRNPKVATMVLVYKDLPTPDRIHMAYLLRCLGVGRWIHNSGAELKGITHWMPLPKPPRVRKSVRK